MATTVVVRANSQQQAIAQAQRFATDLARANERIALLEAENAALRALNPDAALAIPAAATMVPTATAAPLARAFGSAALPGVVAPSVPSVAPNGRAPAIPFGQEIVTATGNKVQLMPNATASRGTPSAAAAPVGQEIISPHGNKVRLLPGPNGQPPATIAQPRVIANAVLDVDKGSGGNVSQPPPPTSDDDRFALIELDLDR